MASIDQGKKVGIVDLTRGELGTRGTPTTRTQEAAAAAKIMGVQVRENLDMADGFFVNDEAHQRKIIALIRKYQPDVILANAPEDRHPDHGRSAKLVSDAAFFSGLRKVETIHEGISQTAWRPAYTFHYIQDRFIQPSFVIDITAYMERKMEAVLTYGTQFTNADTSEPQTYISTPDFLESIIYRAKMMGKMIGVKYGEGFISSKMIGLRDFDCFIKENT
jgi:bacillithiol biosynthesis deacetylase BshB1